MLCEVQRPKTKSQKRWCSLSLMRQKSQMKSLGGPQPTRNYNYGTGQHIRQVLAKIWGENLTKTPFQKSHNARKLAENLQQSPQNSVTKPKGAQRAKYIFFDGWKLLTGAIQTILVEDQKCTALQRRMILHYNCQILKQVIITSPTAKMGVTSSRTKCCLYPTLETAGILVKVIIKNPSTLSFHVRRLKRVWSI